MEETSRSACPHPGSGRPEAVVDVALGVVHHEGRFLVARRPAGAHLGDKWEFPGGKLEPGELPEEALRREIREETGLEPGEAILLHVVEHAYPDRTVRLHSFLCLGAHEVGQATAGLETRWVTINELVALDMPPANRSLLALLQEQFAE